MLHKNAFKCSLAHVTFRMIKTGDWTIVDLVKYLVSVQSTLSGEELQRLKQTSAFAKEDSSAGGNKAGVKVPRFKAKELYEPIDALRELKLPLIDWGTEHRWRPASEECLYTIAVSLLGYSHSYPSSSEILVFAWPQAHATA
jgi:hypothetical protein